MKWTSPIALDVPKNYSLLEVNSIGTVPGANQAFAVGQVSRPEGGYSTSDVYCSWRWSGGATWKMTKASRGGGHRCTRLMN